VTTQVAGIGDLERLRAARATTRERLDDALLKRARALAPKETSTSARGGAAVPWWERLGSSKELGKVHVSLDDADDAVTRRPEGEAAADRVAAEHKDGGDDDATWRPDGAGDGDASRADDDAYRGGQRRTANPAVDEHDALYATAGGAVAEKQEAERREKIRDINRKALALLQSQKAGLAAPDDEEAGGPSHVNCCGAPCACACARGCCCPEAAYHKSIPYFEAKLAELDSAIAQLHADRVARSTKWSSRRRHDRRKRTAWRGCFWRVDDDGEEEEEAEEEEEEEEGASPSTRRKAWTQSRRENIRLRAGRRQRKRIEADFKEVTQQDRHWLAVVATLPWRAAGRVLWTRTKAWARRTWTETLPAWGRTIWNGAKGIVRDYVCCSAGAPPFEPSATAFVTFTRPTAKAQAVGGLLAARPFPMTAAPAPEPRDIIWRNVAVDLNAVARRRWVVNFLILVLLLSWSVVASACANSKSIIDNIGISPGTALYRAMASILPIVLLLSILNLLPLIFQTVARFYERAKAVSRVDLSVVVRFFLFQFVNVYISIVTTAVFSDFREAWKSPVELLKRIAHGTPETSFYFAKLLVFQCGSSPLWLLRAWPFISRGWKTWTVQPPELPAMMYGWAYPKVMMAFTIMVTYWVYSPIIPCIAAIYFFLVNCAFRYLILYVHMPMYESGGQYFYLIASRVCFAIGMSNFILVWYMFVQNLYGFALLVSPLVVITMGFFWFTRDAYVTSSRRTSLNEASDVEKQGHDLTSKFDSSLYLQPALRDLGRFYDFDADFGGSDDDDCDDEEASADGAYEEAPAEEAYEEAPAEEAGEGAPAEAGVRSLGRGWFG